MCCHTSLLAKLRAIYRTPLGENNRKLVPGLYCTSPYVPFTFAEFNLYPSIVVNRNHEFNTVFLSSVSPSKSLNVRVALGTPDTEIYIIHSFDPHSNVCKAGIIP